MSHRRDDRGEGSRGGGGSYYDDRDRRSGGYRDDHRDDRRGYQEGGRGGEGQRQDRPGGHGYNSGGSGGYDRPARFEGQHRGAPHEQHRQGGRGGPGYQAGGRGRGQFDGGRGRGRAQGFPVDPGRLPPEWEEGIGQVPGEFMEVPGLVPSQQKARGSNFAGIQPMQRPKAGGYGTLGKSIRLYANHFLVQRCNNLAVHYHVEIQREYDEAPDSTGEPPPPVPCMPPDSPPLH